MIYEIKTEQTKRIGLLHKEQTKRLQHKEQTRKISARRRANEEITAKRYTDEFTRDGSFTTCKMGRNGRNTRYPWKCAAILPISNKENPCRTGHTTPKIRNTGKDGVPQSAGPTVNIPIYVAGPVTAW